LQPILESPGHGFPKARDRGPRWKRRPSGLRVALIQIGALATVRLLEEFASRKLLGDGMPMFASVAGLESQSVGRSNCS
jgi:hypothetical protein